MLVIVAVPNIYLFYLLWTICGLGAGTILTGINVYCLDVWRGHNGGGPWMHSIHFAYSLGATFGPILATPFLSEKSSIVRPMNISKESRIDELYPISGAIVLASSLGFLVMAMQGSMPIINKDSAQEKLEENPINDCIKSQKKTTPKLFAFVALICIFFLLYCGAEIAMGVYLTTFAVNSLLHTTMAEGAFVNAVFWGSFTAGRFLSIFFAIYLNPLNTMVLSSVLCIGNDN